MAHSVFTPLVDTCDSVLQLAGVLFPLSTGYMYFVVKRTGHNPVLPFVRSRLSIDIDLKFFEYLRQCYIEAKKDRVIPLLNKWSWRLAVACILAYYLFGVLEAIY